MEVFLFWWNGGGRGGGVICDRDWIVVGFGFGISSCIDCVRGVRV